MIANKVPVENITDAMLLDLSYGIRYFSLWGDVSDQDLIYWRNARTVLVDRLDALEQLKIKHCFPIDSKKTLSGQLWEACDRCGHEPIYMSTGFCEECSK